MYFHVHKQQLTDSFPTITYNFSQINDMCAAKRLRECEGLWLIALNHSYSKSANGIFVFEFDMHELAEV